MTSEDLTRTLDGVSACSAELARALRSDPMNYEATAAMSAKLNQLLVRLGEECARWTLRALKEARSRN